MKSSIFIAILLLSLSGCTLCRRQQQSGGQKVLASRAIELKAMYHYRARTVSGHDENLSFGRDGIISAIYINEGETVKKGELLARLESESIKAHHDSMAFEVQKSRLKLSRYEKLLSIDDISQKEYNTAEKEYAQQLKLFDEFEELLQAGILKAPYSGIVVKRAKSEENHVKTGEVIIKLADFKTNHVEFKVPKREIPLIEITQEIYFSFKKNRKRDYPISIDNEEMRSFQNDNEVLVQAQFKALSDTTINAAIKTGEGEVSIKTNVPIGCTIIPRDALTTASNGVQEMVWVIKRRNNTIHKATIQIVGLYGHNQVMVLGLKPKEILVRQPSGSLKENQKIQFYFEEE